jgi:hypothetical protein
MFNSPRITGTKGEIMKRFSVSVAALLACLTLLHAGVVFAQSGNAQLGGTIEDSTRALIPGVTVTATNVDTNVTQTMLSNDSGAYTFAALPPGKYKVSADLTGFKKVVNDEVVLPYAGQVRLNFTLEIGQGNQSVEIVANASNRLSESSASVGDVLSKDQIQNLPLVGQNVLDLMVTLPGFRKDPNFATLDNINGLNMDSVNVTRDGITVNDVRNSTTIYGTNTLSTTVILPELVGEVRMILSPVDAELGRGNSQLQISTRSGTNRYSGSAGWNALNSALNANTWTNNHTAFTDPFSGATTLYTPKTWTNQHQITLAFGGPVKIPGVYDGKNKTFFYGVYSKNIRATREQIATTVLTDTARQGIFRYWSGYNPVGWNSTASAVYPMQATTATLIAVDQAGLPVRPVADPLSPTSNPAGAGFIPYSGNLICFSVFGTQRLSESGGMVPFTPADCPSGQASIPTGRPAWDNFRPNGDSSGLIAKFLKATPHATYYGAGDGLNYGQVRWIRPREGTSDTTGALAGTNPNANITQYNLKIDHNFSPRHKVSGSWTYQQDSSASSPPGYPDGFFGTTYRKPHTLAVNATSTLSPQIVNEFRFGFTYTKNDQAPAWESLDQTTRDGARNLMLPGGTGVRNTDYQYLALVNSASGNVAVSNGFMNTTLMTNYQRSLAYTWADTLSWNKGKHAFKFGVEWRPTNTEGNGGSQSYGTVNIGNASNATTSPFATTTNFNTPTDSVGYLPGFLNAAGLGQPVARTNATSLLQYLNGSVGSVSQNYWINGAANVSQAYWDDISTQGERVRKQFGQSISLFAKDDFKMTKSLTLNLGLRWDFFGSPYFDNGLTSTLKDGGYGAFGATRAAQTSLAQFNADPFAYFLHPGNLYLSGYGSRATTPLNCDQGVQQNALLPVSSCDPTTVASVQFIGPDTPNPGVRAVPANYGNFGPAIGFAYQLPWFGEGKTTIRGGYQQTFGSAGQNAGTLGGGTEGTLGNAPGATTTGTLTGHINDAVFQNIISTQGRAINLGDISSLVPMKPDQATPGASLSVYGLTAGPQALLSWSVYDPKITTNYTQNMTLSVSRQVSRNITVEARYTGTLGRKLNGFVDINQNNVYYNPEILQALSDARAGKCTANASAYKANYTDKGINPCDVNNDPVLLDQMMAGLNLNVGVSGTTGTGVYGAVGTTNAAGVYQSGAQQLRRSATFQNNLSWGNFSGVADSLIALAPTTAQGRQNLPIDPATGVAITNVGQTGLRNGCDRMGNNAAYVQQTITTTNNVPVVTFNPGFNASNATPLRCFPEDLLHSNPQFGSTAGTSVRYNTGTGRSSYNSLQMQVTARPIQGISTSATWVWAKSFALAGSGYMDPAHRDLDFAVQGLNAHSLRTNATFELPIGPNKLVMGNSSGFVARMVERWQTSMIFNASSPVYSTLNPGQNHFYAPSGYDVASTNWALPKSDFKWNEGTNTGSIYGNNYLSVTDPSCYDPSIVTLGDKMGTNLGRIDANPTTGAAAAGACIISALAARNPDGTAGEVLLKYPEPGKVGSLGKSNMKGIGQWTLDVSASKAFRVTESTSFQFRIDANNVLNHPVPNTPNISAGPPGFGVVTGKGNQVRVVQASLRINF